MRCVKCGLNSPMVQERPGVWRCTACDPDPGYLAFEDEETIPGQSQAESFTKGVEAALAVVDQEAAGVRAIMEDRFNRGTDVGGIILLKWATLRALRQQIANLISIPDATPSED